MKVNDRGVVDVLSKIYKQLEQAETIGKYENLLPRNTIINISKCKADIETLRAIIEFNN